MRPGTLRNKSANPRAGLCSSASRAAESLILRWPLDLLAIATVGLAVIFYSRMLLLLRPPVATLGPAILIACLVFLPLLFPLGKRQLALSTFLIMSLLFALVLFLQFVIRTGLYTDWRAIGTYAGPFLSFPIAYLMRRHGWRRVLALAFWGSLGYAAIYIALSIALKAGLAPQAQGDGLILRDPVRGARFYANPTLMSFAFFGALWLASMHTRSGRWVAAAIAGGAAILAALALGLTYSRVAILLVVLVLSLSVFVPARGRAWLLQAYALSYFPVWLVLMLLTFPISDLFLAIDPVTLHLRADGLERAFESFAESPWLGLGIPTDPGLLSEHFGIPFYGEDLGGIGLLVIMGILGLSWVSAFIILLSAILVSFSRSPDPLMGALSLTGMVFLFNASFMPNLLQGEASVFSGMILALALQPGRPGQDR